MKKLLSLLTCFIIGTSATTILINKNLQMKINKMNSTADYINYQTEKEWEKAMLQNNHFNLLTYRIPELNGATFSGISLNLQKVKDNLVTSDYYINGPVQMIGTTPSSISQHIANNKNGNSPLTVSYDSFSTQVKNKVSTTIKNEIDTGASVDWDFGIPLIENNHISIHFNYKHDSSKTQEKSFTMTQTFDKFSTTVEPGKSETIDYILMTGTESLTMDARAKVDLKDSNLVFTKEGKEISYSWNDIINGQPGKFKGIGQIFAKLIDTDNLHLGYDQGFIGIGTSSTPEGNIYNFDDIYTHIEFNMSQNGFTTDIQTKKN